jgi:hypothetical protein
MQVMVFAVAVAAMVAACKLAFVEGCKALARFSF